MAVFRWGPQRGVKCRAYEKNTIFDQYPALSRT